MEKKTTKFKVVLKTVGKEHTAEGSSVDSALAKMGLSWNDIKGKGTITVYKGNKSHEHIFSTPGLRKIFGNKLVRLNWGRNLEYLLKENVKTNIPEKLNIKK